MGDDAVILHTRTYRERCWLGLRRAEMVEITAGARAERACRATRRGQPIEAGDAADRRCRAVADRADDRR